MKIYNIQSSSPLLVEYGYNDDFEYVVTENYMYDKNDDSYMQCSFSSFNFPEDISCFTYDHYNYEEVNKEVYLVGLSVIDNYNFSFGCDDFRLKGRMQTMKFIYMLKMASV